MSKNLQKVASKKLGSFNNSLTHLLELEDEAEVTKLEKKEVSEKLKKEIAQAKADLLSKLVEDLSLDISNEELGYIAEGSLATFKRKLPTVLFNSQNEWNGPDKLPKKDFIRTYKNEIIEDDESIVVLDEQGQEILYNYAKGCWMIPLRDDYGYRKVNPPKKWCECPRWV